MSISLPREIQRLHDLAHNVWWSWTPQARELFEQFDPALWRLTHHNPIKQLQEASPEHLTALSRNALFLRQYEATVKAYDDYMSATDHWFGKIFPSWRISSLRTFLPSLDFISRCPFIVADWEF